MAGTNTLKDSESNVIIGLGDYVHTCAASNIYSVNVHVDMLPTSALSIVIKKNSTTVVSSVAPTTPQSHMDLACKINAAANDVIHVVLSSSNVNDLQANTVKSIVVVRQGLV
jgi:hypothetical protein